MNHTHLTLRPWRLSDAAVLPGLIGDPAVQRNLRDGLPLPYTEEDARAFEPLSRAYGLPASTEEEKARKAAVMAQALDAACAAPLALMEALCQAIDLHREYAQKGTAIAISDVGVGVACCKAALQGASLNVFINTKSMADRAKAEAVNEKARAMLDASCALADGIFADVAARFQ